MRYEKGGSWCLRTWVCRWLSQPAGSQTRRNLFPQQLGFRNQEILPRHSCFPRGVRIVGSTVEKDTEHVVLQRGGPPAAERNLDPSGDGVVFGDMAAGVGADDVPSR